MSAMSTHFTPETFKFLRGLARNNDRDWFEPRREIYERALRAPMLALVEEINASFESFAPEHVRPPNKIMMRIYRDTRFSKNKLPYKTHLAAWWSRRGMEKTSGGGFYLQVGPKEVLMAAGVYMPEREQLLAIRRWLAEHHVHYSAVLKKTLKPHAGTSFIPSDAQALTRMPKGFAPDHPAGDLLRARNWAVSVSFPAELALDASLGGEIVRRFKLATPLVGTLNTAILGDHHAAENQSSKPRRPLF